MRKINYSMLPILLISLSSLQAVELDSISVSSTIDDEYTTTSKSISSTSVITAEEINKINPNSVAEILNKIPGITASLVGTDSLKVHIRGIDNQMYMGEQPGVAIVIDGVPVYETTGKINVDLDNIESIKVIKGGASYLYGNDAIAGAVVITTKRPKGESSSRIEMEAGSYGTRNLTVSTNQALENSLLQLQGSYRNTDGYWDDAYVKSKGLNGKYQYFLNDNSDLTFGLDYTKRETGDGNSVSGITEAINNPTSAGYYSYGGYYNSDLIKTFLTFTNTFSDDSELMLRVHNYIDDKDYMTNRTAYHYYEKWNQMGAKGEYKKSFDALSTMIGFDIQDNTTDEVGYTVATNALRADSMIEEKVNALYFETNYEVNDNLLTTFNIRYDHLKNSVDDKLGGFDAEGTYDTLSYRAGANYAFSKEFNLYTSVSTGFRAPTAGQVSNNLENLAADPTLNIPTSLDVETTYNYEIGLKGKSGLFSYDASIFQIDRKDYIGRIAGSYVDDDDTGASYDNVGDMRSRGFELSLSSDSSKTLSFDLAYTFLQAKFTKYTISQQTAGYFTFTSADNTYNYNVDLSGNYVSRSPKHTVNLTTNFKATEKWDISPELVYKGSYYADETNRYKQKAYSVVNLRTDYKISDNLEIFGKIENLLDKNYFLFVNVSTATEATMNNATIRVAAPRSYYVGLRYKF